MQRVRRISSLLQVDVVECIRVDDDAAAWNQVAEVHLQCGRVHCHQYVWSVAWRVDVARREADLEPGDARKRTGRRTNLRWVVRER